ncbi:hypothetical protein BN946_scf185014.g74 [Trametes cinnabarina]|uniref:N-acetyltransferase domain-containing protein n=1 Tax=Pycnoporus cinnabarinus TaxID=5643 RepID=A0A060SMY9_PYCCI|nr:hypothetical protein BN946_scf185014.g74 [Trametes cinnabarina]
MQDLHCVCFSDIAAIVKAVEPYDDGLMNFAVGTLHDNIQKPPHPAGSREAYFLGIYHGNDLQLTLALAPTDHAWQLGCPQAVLESFTTPSLKAATDLLATSLLDVAHPFIVANVFGDNEIVRTFLESWRAVAATKGIRLRLTDLILDTRSSYATRQTVAPPPDSPPAFKIVRATIGDFEELFPTYLDFRTETVGPRSLDVEEEHLRFTIAQGTSWLCRINDALVGFIVLGRVTPKTIAIRHVYVVPEHRRKGIAGGLVSAVCRYYLGVRPVGYDGIPEGDPTVGIKSFVCINALESAENVYRKAGFLFPERTASGLAAGGRDPATGQRAWFRSVLGGVEPEQVSSV